MTEIIRSLVRLGDKFRGPVSTTTEVTPELILQMVVDIDELRRVVKHLQLDLEDLRERIR